MGSGDDDDKRSSRNANGCSTAFLGSYFYHKNGRNHVFFGSVHLISFVIIVSLIYFNRILLKQKSAENANVVKWLILPSYLPFLYAFALLSLLFGVLDYVCRFVSDESNSIDIILYPLQIGLFHWFYEGLALFLTKYGVGIHAIQDIVKSSCCWAVLTGGWMFVLFLVGRHTWVADSRSRTDTVFGMGLTYALVLSVFYGLYALLPPTDRMYYRPAMTFYARSSAAFYAVLAILVSVFFLDSSGSQCGVSAVLFVITSFIRPFVLYHVLVMDSQYWQGLCPAKGNPLSEVWDRLGVQTAITLAGDLDAFRQTHRRLPIFHFGLIQMDKDLTFVSGGFSRVYFGTIHHTRVALKVLFAMELEPHDIQQFYKEASILYKLRHENVVECRGICVMPPALTIVLELCKYGSLFDFLHKPTVPVYAEFDRDSISSATVVVVTSTLHDNNAATKDVEMQANVFDMSPCEDYPAPTNAPISKAAALDDSGGRERLSARFSGLKRPSNNNMRPSSSVLDRESNTTASGQHERRSLFRLRLSHLSERLSDLIQTSSSGGNKHFSQPKPVAFRPVGEQLEMKTRLNMMRDAVSAIAFLHRQGYMHCDIKSLNFLVCENYVLKLADMGEVREIHPADGSTYSKAPNPARNWAPPELLEEGASAQSYSEKSDIYGLCIVLSELLTSDIPFGDLPDRSSPVAWHHLLVTQQLRPKLPDDLPHELRRIIQEGWSSKPSLRPSADDILEVLMEYCLLGPSSSSSSSSSSFLRGEDDSEGHTHA